MPQEIEFVHVAAQDAQRQDHAPRAAGAGVGRAGRRHLDADGRLTCRAGRHDGGRPASVAQRRRRLRRETEDAMDELQETILRLRGEGVPRGGRRPRGRRRHAADHAAASSTRSRWSRSSASSRRSTRSRSRTPRPRPEAFDTVNSIAALVQRVPRQAGVGRRVMAYSRRRLRELVPAGAGRASATPACSRRSASSTRRRAPTSRSSSRRGAPAEAGHQPVRQQLPRPLQPPRGGRGGARGPRPPRLRHVLGALHLRHPGHPPRAREQAHRRSSAPRTRCSSPPAWTPTPASSRRSSPSRT